MKLKFNVGMVSLAGISGTFPRGHGNYFTINFEGSDAMVINMSHEDFKDAERQGIIDDGIECYVFGHNGKYAVYVTDERIPKEALKPWNTYSMCGEHVANVVRFVNNIPDFECIMKTNPEFAGKIARSTSYDYDSVPGHVVKTITCGCCGDRHELKPVVYNRPWIVKPDSLSLHGEEIDSSL